LPQPPIIVLGATNRPYDVDPAILRRLPRSFEIALPNYDSRLQLLNLFLEKQSMTKEAREYITTVAKKTEGYSGSDLKEVCRAAAWEPVRELTSGASQMAVGAADNNKSKPKKGHLKRTSSGFPARGTKARPVNANDFDLALQKVKKTGDSARQFHKKEFIRGREDRRAMAEEINKKLNGNTAATQQQVDLNQLLAAAMAAMGNVQNGNNAKGHHDDDHGDGDEPPEMFVDATNGLN
jgi:SpoVK/Ycf46/Vps4 family AAA+-type ATPase